MLALLVAGLLTGLAQAQTVVSGAIAADTRWSLASSPYLVSADIVVQGGATLSIDAGVLVSMAPGTRLTLQDGTLRALGTAANPIRVRSERARLGQAAAAGDWDQWIFSPGTSTHTRLDHVQFEHGKGLLVQGSAPVLNHLDIRHQQGAAITIDLAASPTGVGNQASGNGLNGIAVPAGAITGSARWGLRGIPYVLASGTVSVGAAPTISSVSPSVVEQGQTLSLTVNGSRLTGVAAANLDQAGLGLTPFTGGSSTQAFFQLAVAANAPAGPASLRLLVDAGEVLLPNAITVTPPMPAITALSPTSVTAGAGPSTLTLDGRNFVSASVVTANAAALPTEFVSTTQLRATLPLQTAAGSLSFQVRSPNAQQPDQPLLSNTVVLAVQPPVPPVVTIEPTPIALPPDGSSRDITVRFSKADFRDHTLNFSISDTTKATVTPASVVVPAGQGSLKISIVPKVSGTVSLIMESPTLARVSVPLFITADYRGANTSYAAPVGVLVQTVPVPETVSRSVTQPPVGVAVGAVLTGVAPGAWTLGSNVSLSVQGAGIPAGAQVLVVPPTGITLGGVNVNPDGSQLQVPVTTAADAAPGPRRLVVRDAAGKDLVFADPARAILQLATGLPVVESVEPLFGARGSTVQLLVRGQHLQQASVRLLPDTGVAVDAAPVVSVDGKTLRLSVQIAADAPAGARVLQVSTPAGLSTAEASAANAFTVVSAVRQSVTPIASTVVGVRVEGGGVVQTAPVQPASAFVGVLSGAGITQVLPNTAVIGTDTVVTVRGAGLQSVTAASIVPATGASLVAGPGVNGDGTELSLTLRVAADAPLGPRRLVLTATDRPLTFSRVGDGVLLISAPIPELASVEPQVLLAGQGAVRMTVRGRNLSNVSAVRIEPAQGLTVAGPFESAADGSVLNFSVTVAAGAASGSRTVVITSAAGDSSTEPAAGNTVRVASQAGPTYAHVTGAVVGVVHGSSAPAPVAYDGALASVPVGVMVGTPPAPEPVAGTSASLPVGVVVGSTAQAVSPSGWLQGASGTILVTGLALDTVSSVSVVPSTGLLLGAPVPAGSTAVNLTISVAPDAPQGLRKLRLFNAAGAEILFARPGTDSFGIGSLPTLTSIAPIVLEQGKAAMFSVRGSNLSRVLRLVFDPDSGVATTGDLVWSQDALGELLTVPVSVSTNAAPGNRVVRLQVHGGISSAEATPANTVNVVAPQ